MAEDEEELSFDDDSIHFDSFDESQQQTGLSVVGEAFGKVLPQLIKAGEATKSRLAEIAVEVADDVSGNGKTLEVFGTVKHLKEFITSLEEAMKDEAFDEAQKYGKTGTIAGMKFELGATAAAWDYSACEAWVKLKEQEDAISEKRKRLEKKMQVIKGVKPVDDEEFGQICGAKQTKGKSEIVKFPIKK
jgi:hypothetical protein